MPTGAASRFAIRYGVLRGAPDTQAVFDGLYAASTVSFWLDSNQAGRFSFLGDDRGPLSETVIGRDGTTTVRDRYGDRVEHREVPAVLDARLAERRIAPTSLPFDLVGGYVGFIGMARGPGFVPAGQPAGAMWLFADRVVAVDHQAELTYLLAVEDGRIGIRAAADAWIVETMRRVRGLPSWQPAVAEAQVRRSGLGGSPAGERYRQLRRGRPAACAALLSFGEVSLVSWASGSVLRSGVPGQYPTGATRWPAPAVAAGSDPPASTARLLAALETRAPGGAPAEPAARPDRPVALGYLGLAGGVDLSLVMPEAVAAVAAVPRRSDVALVGAAEPAA